MKVKALAVAVAVGALTLSGAAFAGDAAKGKVVFEEKCSECHEADEFKGEKAADIVAKANDAKVVEKHKKKKVAPTAAELADAAAFFASAK